MDTRNELVAAVSTAIKDNGYHETLPDRIKRIIKLVSTLSQDKSNYPFLWNLLKYTRNDWNLRAVTYVLVIKYIMNPELRMFRSDKISPKKILAKNVFIDVDDVLTIWKYFLSKNYGGKTSLPRLLKNATEIWLNELKPSDYIDDNISGSSLKNIIKIVHPKPKDDIQSHLFKSILDGSIKSSRKWSINNLELSIPFMSYKNILMNLPLIEKTIVDSKAIVGKLSNLDEVKKSGVLPFEFIDAYEAVASIHYRRAIVKAIKYSFSSFEVKKGKYLIAINGSITMAGNPIKHASVFGYVLHDAVRRSGGEVDMVIFNDKIQTIECNGINVMKLYHRIRARVGKIPLLCTVYEYANMASLPYDVIFILGNMQYSHSPPVSVPSGLVININLNGFLRTQSPQTVGSNILELPGISSKIFDYLGVISNPLGLVEMIANS
jgi:hypothetical protein